MITLRGWLASSLLGATIVFSSPTISSAQESEKPDPTRAVMELIRNKEFSDALKAIKELEATSPNSPALRTMKLQWLAGLRAGGAEGLDAAAEAKSMLDSTRKSASTDPNKLGDLTAIANFALPLIAQFGSNEAALEEAKATLAAVDTPEFAKKGQLFAQSLSGLQRNLAMMLRQAGKGEEATKVVMESIARMESLAKDNPDAKGMPAMVLNAMVYAFNFTTGSEREAMVAKAISSAEKLISESPSAESVGAYTNTYGTIISSMSRENPEELASF